MYDEEANCDHDMETLYCETCGGYQGEQCNHCGYWYDGGDHLAAQPHLWCTCGQQASTQELETPE